MPGSIRAVVDSVRRYNGPQAASYLVICKGLDSPKRRYRCYVPDGVMVPHAGDRLEVRRAGKDGKTWIFWA